LILMQPCCLCSPPQKLGFVLGLFFCWHLFSTTWPALFLALFFPQERVFNNFSALFLGLFLVAKPVFSITSRLRFLKKVFFFVFSVLKSKNTSLFGAAGRRRILPAAPARRDTNKATTLGQSCQAKIAAMTASGAESPSGARTCKMSELKLRPPTEAVWPMGGYEGKSWPWLAGRGGRAGR
jgi:hypothetical protein